MNDEHTPASQPESWLNKIKRIFSPQPKGYAHLISQLRATDSQDLLDNDALYIIEGALKVTNMQTRDIMIPRSQMVCITINEDPQNFSPELLQLAIPVTLLSGSLSMRFLDSFWLRICFLYCLAAIVWKNRLILNRY